MKIRLPFVTCKAHEAALKAKTNELVSAERSLSHTSHSHRLLAAENEELRDELNVADQTIISLISKKD